MIVDDDNAQAHRCSARGNVMMIRVHSADAVDGKPAAARCRPFAQATRPGFPAFKVGMLEPTVEAKARPVVVNSQYNSPVLQMEVGVDGSRRPMARGICCRFRGHAGQLVDHRCGKLKIGRIEREAEIDRPLLSKPFGKRRELNRELGIAAVAVLIVPVQAPG